MQPQQQQPPYYNPNPQPSGSPYNFIMNAPNNGAKPPVAAGSGMVKKILLIAGLFAVVIVAIVIVFSIVTSGSSADKASLIKLSQQQNELIRLSGIASTKATSQTVKNLAVSTELSIQTDQSALLTYMDKHGGRPGMKELALGASSASDKLLAAAESTSTYDSAYTGLMNDQLVAYQTGLSKVASTATSNMLKTTLNKSLATTTLLLKDTTATKATL